MKAVLWLEPFIAANRPLVRRASLLSSRPYRFFATTSRRYSDEPDSRSSRNIDNNVTKGELSHYEHMVAKDKDKQVRTPWHREGSDKPPVARNRSAGAMTKGKLLTTPSRLLKLVLPLTVGDHNTDRKDAAPLALLVHPQQPLSYLERLIQVEVPTVKDKNGKEKPPDVNFSAEGSEDDSMRPRKSKNDEDHEIDRPDSNGVGKGGSVETYSGLGRKAKKGEDEEQEFVRWSKSTEMGDFIRDAARGKEFAVDIEGAPQEIRIGVPSFDDRTYYLRMRLRKKARQIASLADIKKECDLAAHKGAQRIALAGLAGLLGWSCVVGWLTFETKLGWDVMEPVTYLVGLIGVIIGYGYFLYHNREVSYRSALNLTVSTRQNKLYQNRGFDLHKWQMLIDEVNALRRDIIAVANEYDVEWDEKKDTHHDKVIKVLRHSRHQKGEKSNKKDDEDDEGD